MRGEVISRLRWWWLWNSWRFDPSVRWYQLRIATLGAWAKLVCAFKGHLEHPVSDDDPEGSTFCTRCGAYWCGGREWAETKVYFLPKEQEAESETTG